MGALNRLFLVICFLAICLAWKHAVGVCEIGEESGGASDGAPGGADEGDIRECSPHGVANTLWAYERMGRKTGERLSEIIYFKRGANEELI
jgi:hypothetical protein